MKKLLFNKSGMTLVETMMVVAIMSILLVAIVPYFHTSRTVSTFSNQQTEIMQNGQTGISKIVNECRQAKRIIGVSSIDNTSGFIFLINKDNEEVGFKRYIYRGKSMLGFMKNGQVYPLAGPIAKLTFDGKKEDGKTSTIIGTKIKSLDIAVEITDEEDQTQVFPFSATVYIRNTPEILDAFKYAALSDNNITLDSIGVVIGDIHANSQISEPGSFIIHGSATDQDDGISEPFPLVSYASYTTPIDNYQNYESIADHIYDANFKFEADNSPYTGIYYIRNNCDAIFDDNAILNGTVIAEGAILINGSNAQINAQGIYPAAITGKNLEINENYFSCTGAIYVEGNININGTCATFTADPDINIALVASGDINIKDQYFNATGSLISLNNINLLSDNAIVRHSNYFPCIVAKNSFTTSDAYFQGYGVIHAKEDINITGINAYIVGTVFSGNNMNCNSQDLIIWFDATIPDNPPPYFY
jgi:prepilin-type N-terminal cleavage/methylation domain-containing protein